MLCLSQCDKYHKYSVCFIHLPIGHQNQKLIAENNRNLLFLIFLCTGWTALQLQEACGWGVGWAQLGYWIFLFMPSPFWTSLQYGGPGPCSKSGKVAFTSPLRPRLWNLYNITSATCCWPTRVTKASPDLWGGERNLPLEGRIAIVALHRATHIGLGKICAH